MPRVKAYVRWQAERRGRSGAGRPAPVPDFAPVSINLDLTTACNFACDHCVDKQILNQPIRFDHDRLCDALRLLADRGLKSVIVIGGGEPTLYKHFVETIRLMKRLGLAVAIVSNGSGMARIREVADCLEAVDWVRLSLDAGTDATFQAMHKPRKRVTLEEVCAAVPEIKVLNRAFPVGFSFVITWKGATIHEADIVENLTEIVPAAALARDSRFDYIALKPFLTRARTNNAEIVDLRDTDRHFADVIARIRAEVDRARALERADFKVYETTNLKVLENRSYRNYTRQPRQCHMQFFRQVLSPLG
ncbi:MAG: radical SAM protein, partial [Planctomycetes bacterium]|nr:radical SAM protein [Planctomycetota bacterium]